MEILNGLLPGSNKNRVSPFRNSENNSNISVRPCKKAPTTTNKRNQRPSDLRSLKWSPRVPLAPPEWLCGCWCPHCSPGHPAVQPKASSQNSPRPAAWATQGALSTSSVEDRRNPSKTHEVRTKDQQLTVLTPIYINDASIFTSIYTSIFTSINNQQSTRINKQQSTPINKQQ